MSKTKNFLLMLKQGIKGVFQFKAQFIIIIILAFVATFILSISVSTQRSMNNSFDKIVKPVKKFDYQGNIQVYSDADSTSDPYMLATELDNSTPTDIKITVGGKDNGTKADQKVLSETGSFNYVFYTGPKGDWYKDANGDKINTFLTEGTNEFLATNPAGKLDDSFFSKLNVFYFKSLFKDLDAISDNAQKGIALSKFDSQTKYSPIAIYTSENPYWYKAFVNDLSKTDTLDEMFNLDGTEGLPHRDIFNNVLGGVSTLTGFLNNTVKTYNNDDTNSSHKITTVEQAESFLFGIGSVANTKWSVDENKAYSTDITIDSEDPTGNDNVYAVYSADGDNSSSSDAIWYSGLRGISNPFVDANTKKINTLSAMSEQDKKDYSYSNVTNWDNFSFLSFSPGINPEFINSRSQSMYGNMTVTGEWYSTTMNASMLELIASGNYPDKNNGVPLETIFRVHNELAAASTGFDYQIRREATYFDANNQLKFRAVILDENENYNFTILHGRYPAAGEVAVNEQFARKNKIKVGSIIKAGDALLPVSAIATDALSYLPSQDLNNPIPNPKVSSFLYGSAATIMSIWGGTAVNSGSDDSVTQEVSYFLYDHNIKNIAGTKAEREAAYLALYSNSKENAVNNAAAVKEFVNNGKIKTKVGSNLVYKDFGTSPYRYSFSIQPMIFKIYDAITFTAAAIIAIIAVISVVVCVKKTIDLNSKQIGILKALGEQPKGISVNYISYALILGVIVVPVAWVIGNILQIPFGNMFLTYFSIEPNVVTWDWISFVISFAVLGVGAGAFSYLAAWLITKKPVLSILTSSVKWGRLRFIDFLKNKVFRRAPFSTRFSLTLTSSGSRQIILMTVVMFIASLLMSAVLAIPSVVVRVNNSYYKSTKYANQYNEIPMIGNAPLSKNAISYWNGQDYLENQYVDAGLALDNSGAKYGYYLDPEDYIGTNSAATTFPQYIYDANADTGNNGINDFNSYVLQRSGQILAIVGTVFGNNYFTHLGVSFSVGMVDKFYGIILHSLEDLTNSMNKGAYTDQKKISEAQNLSGWLTSSIPKIIGAIVNSNAEKSNEGSNASDAGVKTETWKEKVMDAIYKVVPSYVKGYIQKSPSRLDQYGIAYNNQIYIPGQETLATSVENSGTKFNGINQKMTLTGLDKYQNSIVINNGDKDKVFLPADVKEKLLDRINVPMNDKAFGGSASDVLNTSVVYNGMTLYDDSTHSFNIPVLPNKQAASSYKLNKGESYNGWNNLVQLIQMQSGGKWFDLPKTAWVYDDSDYADYLSGQTDELSKAEGKELPYVTANDPKYDPSTPNNGWEYDDSLKAKGKYYLEPERLDNNKLTFTNEFETQNDKTVLKDRALLFKGFKYGKDGTPTGTYVRPEYQFKNMKLMIPQKWADEDKLLWPDGSHALNGVKTNQWYKKDVSAADIPQSVKDGYKKLATTNPNLDKSALDDSEKWIVINPYDLNYNGANFSENQKMALTNLVDGPAYWYRYAFAGNAQLRVESNVNVTDMFGDTGANLNGNASINLNSVGSIDSYNDKFIACDGDIANQLLNYPLYRDYQYNYQTFDKSSKIAANTYYDGAKSDYDRYKLTDTQNKSFINNDWTTDKSAKEQDLWRLSYDKYVKAIGGNENIENYAPHTFYNTKLSNIDEPLEYTSQISFSKGIRVGQQSIALGDAMPGNAISYIQSSTLLSTTKHLISQLATLAVAIGAMLMVAIIITAALLTMLTGDIYIEQYKRFMVLLRALGYSKIQIFAYTFAPVSVLSLVAWAGGSVLAWGLIWIGTNILWTAGFAIPMGITWWPIVASFIVMFLSYAGSLWVSSGKARKANPSEVLTATAE